jgi:aspartate ammonia-lyase
MTATRTPKTRLEHDLIGDIAVPASALFGAQTQRAVENFPLRGQRAIGDFPALVQGLLRVKQAAALANQKAGLLNRRIGGAIVDAARSLLARPRPDQFPVHCLHGGGGTSANMNANEVLANLAEERLGGRRGRYAKVHPNDHVNQQQSTNDVYPSACHLAVILQWPRLEQALGALVAGLDGKARQWKSRRRLARTCLQDAVAITFADLLGGYVQFIRRRGKAVGQAVDALHAVPLGGTIVGRREDVAPGYWKAVIPALRQVTGDRRYRRSANLFDAAQNMDDLVRVSSELDLLARGLVKIGQDLRLMNSGPEAGLGEIALPAVQPGSSIMPGKINPVIPEHVMQLCFKVMGLHAQCQATLDHGELDLNVWESAAVFGVLESMELLASAALVLEERAIRDLRLDAARNERNADTLIPLLTEAMKKHGYSRVSDLCKRARKEGVPVRTLLAEAFP